MHIYTLYIDDIDIFKFFLFSKMGSYHTSWNPFVSLYEIKWTAFGVTKYRFPQHFSGRGGVATEVERNGNVVRLGGVSCAHYLFIYWKGGILHVCGATPILVVSSQNFCFSLLHVC